LLKVCGCCHREMQRRQTWQGGKRGQLSVLWGFCITTAVVDAGNNNSHGLWCRRLVGFGDL